MTDKSSLIAAFWQGAQEVSEGWQELPARLRGRADWLRERGRIKDSELMYDAATEIEALRKAIS